MKERVEDRFSYFDIDKLRYNLNFNLIEDFDRIRIELRKQSDSKIDGLLNKLKPSEKRRDKEIYLKAEFDIFKDFTYDTNILHMGYPRNMQFITQGSLFVESGCYNPSSESPIAYEKLFLNFSDELILNTGAIPKSSIRIEKRQKTFGIRRDDYKRKIYGLIGVKTDLTHQLPTDWFLRKS